MKLFRFIITAVLAACSLVLAAQESKREFRGAWLNTVYQTQYKRHSTEQNKAYLVRQLDSLKAMGINAVIFQVRAQADAFYDSRYEPWSRYLTDGGKAPVPFWDPLEFMVEQAHRRGMELHAWLNPYRVTTSAKQTVPKGHIALRHPERFIRYDGKLYFDPGRPENREYIGKIVDDIVARYDIDGIHFDDYFYPYPVKGKAFADDASYRKYGKGMARNDWRRHNVDLLIEDLHRRISAAKPWVRFGVSPFGIWRNKTSDPRGSETSGLQNYDALYADVLLWEEKGWVDYLLPQLYWELGHKSASYLTLVDWWNKNAGQKRHIYVGQDVKRTIDKSELCNKVSLTRRACNIRGNCWWPGYELTRNTGGVADSLAVQYQHYPALVPQYPWIFDGKPHTVEGLKLGQKRVISWSAPKPCGKAADVVRYAIYRFDNLDDIDIERHDALVDIVGTNEFTAPQPGCYVVTAIDRVNNESEPSAPVVIRR